MTSVSFCLYVADKNKADFISKYFCLFFNQINIRYFNSLTEKSLTYEIIFVLRVYSQLNYLMVTDQFRPLDNSDHPTQTLPTQTPPDSDSPDSDHSRFRPLPTQTPQIQNPLPIQTPNPTPIQTPHFDLKS